MDPVYELAMIEHFLVGVHDTYVLVLELFVVLFGTLQSKEM
jgi:hypothetical protein